MIKLVIGKNEADQRLDRFLRKYMKKAPLSVIYKTIRKDLKLNGKRAGEDTMLSEGDELTLYIPEDVLKKYTEPLPRKTAPRQFTIAYEDENILVVSKPLGLLTHGDAHEKKNTLANQVCGYLQEKGEYNPGREKTFVPSPVNRLDRNTTGLVIFGKNAEALRDFTGYIREKNHIRKFYMTVVSGEFSEKKVFHGRLEKDFRKNIVKVSEDSGKESLTIVRPVKTGRRFSMVEVELVTGRTHQIRAHLAEAGFPLVGDPKYGDAKVNNYARNNYGIRAQLLHAYRLEFKGMEGRFSYLDGKTIEIPLTEAFGKIAERI